MGQLCKAGSASRRDGVCLLARACVHPDLNSNVYKPGSLKPNDIQKPKTTQKLGNSSLL